MKARQAFAMALALALVGFSILSLAPRARAATLSLDLYHSGPGGGPPNGGWGRDAGNLTKPGPYLTYPNGTQLRLTLYSVDSQNHNFFVDYNGDKNSTSEPRSGTFSSPAGTTFFVTLNRTGNFTYRCEFHKTMTGWINMTAATGPTVTIGGFTLDTTQLIVLGVVAAAGIGGALVLHRMRRRRPPLDEETEIPRGPVPRSPR